jgi:hypothetical protein
MLIIYLIGVLVSFIYLTSISRSWVFVPINFTLALFSWITFVATIGAVLIILQHRREDKKWELEVDVDPDTGQRTSTIKQIN